MNVDELKSCFESLYKEGTKQRNLLNVFMGCQCIGNGHALLTVLGRDLESLNSIKIEGADNRTADLLGGVIEATEKMLPF